MIEDAYLARRRVGTVCLLRNQRLRADVTAPGAMLGCVVPRRHFGQEEVLPEGIDLNAARYRRPPS